LENPKSSNGIGLLTEVVIVRLHCSHDPQEERLGHPEPPSEMLVVLYARVREVVPEYTIMTPQDAPPHAVMTRQRSTKVLLLLVPL